MNKSKIIDGESKKQLKEFMQQINPKPTLEQIEKLRQEYLARRSGAR